MKAVALFRHTVMVVSPWYWSCSHTAQMSCQVEHQVMVPTWSCMAASLVMHTLVVGGTIALVVVLFRVLVLVPQQAGF